MSSYPPTPQRKSCNCEDPCISTDDVYYAGPNLPNSGINTYNVLTSVIEKLEAIYAVPTLQKVTEMGNITTLPIIADSFVKIGGDGDNILLDNGTVLPIGDLPIPIFNPSDYDLDEFTNTGIDPFAHVSDIPPPVATALVFLDEGNGNGIVRSDSFRDPALFGNIGLDAFDLSWSDTAGNYGATGASSFAVGDLLTAQGYGSFLIGGGNTSSVDSNYTFQSGYNHSETGVCYANFFTGAGHSVTGGAYATIVGQFANVVANNPNDVNNGDNTMFAVGNGRAQGDGTLLDRSTALQVYKNGRVVAPSLTTALITADTTGKIVATKEYVDSKRPYKVYTALLTRTGATAPTATVLENTIGTITFSYTAVGIYYVNSPGSPGLFTLNKTVVFLQQQPSGSFGNNLGAAATTSNEISIVQTTSSGPNDTNWINPVSIEIRVYN